MTTIAHQLSELYESYRQWVCNNPQVAGDVESTVKWVSYFVAGRISHSSVLSELIYSVSNLLVLFNDRIIHNSTCKIKGGPADRLKIWLTVIEYSEVFIEVAARRRYGSRGKWTVAVILQLIKCAAKLHLLFNYKEHVIQNPPVPPVRRKTIEEEKIRKEEKWKLESMSFALKRSGRLIRKVQGAPPIHLRDWKPLKSVPENGIYEQNSHSIREVLKKETIIAEVVYIVKPLLHLYAMWRHGPKSWKPWLISLLVDVVSLCAYRKTVHKLTRQQRMEVSRRAFALVLYILRSPFMRLTAGIVYNLSCMQCRRQFLDRHLVQTSCTVPSCLAGYIFLCVVLIGGVSCGAPVILFCVIISDCMWWVLLRDIMGSY